MVRRFSTLLLLLLMLAERPCDRASMSCQGPLPKYEGGVVVVGAAFMSTIAHQQQRYRPPPRTKTAPLATAASSATHRKQSKQNQQRAQLSSSSSSSAFSLSSSSLLPDSLPTHLSHRYYLLRHGQSTANVAQIISSNATQLAYTDMHGLTELGYQQGRNAASQLLTILEQELLLQQEQEGEKREETRQEEVLVFVSSPFARARQTAQACLDGLTLDADHAERLRALGVTLLHRRDNDNDHRCRDVDNDNIVLRDALVERWFGRLDGQAIYTYAYVWPLDKINVTHTAFGVESVAQVCARIRQLIVDLEQAFSDGDSGIGSGEPLQQRYHFVLVGHADVLQIAQLYAAAGASSNRDQLVGAFSSYRFQNGEVRPLRVGTTLQLPPPSPLSAPQRGTSQFEAAASVSNAGPSMERAQAAARDDSKLA